MPFKINISDKGKALKLETESEALIRSKIGDKVPGSNVSSDLEGYELEITGTSDSSGFPGLQGHTGGHLRRVLLTKKDKAMNIKKPKGLRLKKSIRGEEITEKTSQINMKVIKEGSKKFETLLTSKPAEGESAEAEPAKEEPKQEATPAEDKPEEKPVEEKKE